MIINRIYLDSTHQNIAAEAESRSARMNAEEAKKKVEEAKAALTEANKAVKSADENLAATSKWRKKVTKRLLMVTKDLARENSSDEGKNFKQKKVQTMGNTKKYFKPVIFSCRKIRYTNL